MCKNSILAVPFFYKWTFFLAKCALNAVTIIFDTFYLRLQHVLGKVASSSAGFNGLIVVDLGSLSIKSAFFIQSKPTAQKPL